MEKKKPKNRLPKKGWFIAIDNGENEVFIGVRSAVQDKVEKWLKDYSPNPDEQRQYFEENIKVFLGTEATVDIEFFPSVIIHDERPKRTQTESRKERK